MKPFKKIISLLCLSTVVNSVTVNASLSQKISGAWHIVSGSWLVLLGISGQLLGNGVFKRWGDNVPFVGEKDDIYMLWWAKKNGGQPKYKIMSNGVPMAIPDGNTVGFQEFLFGVNGKKAFNIAGLCLEGIGAAKIAVGAKSIYDTKKQEKNTEQIDVEKKLIHAVEEAIEKRTKN